MKKTEDGGGLNGGGGSPVEYVPPNVKQQIELWEKELNCIKIKPALMVILNGQDKA